MKKINIYDEEKNLWVGSGIVSEEGIVDCSANLGDPDSDDPNGIGIYEAIGCGGVAMCQESPVTLHMRGEDGAEASVKIDSVEAAKDRTAGWLAEGDYDPLDDPVEVRGHYSIDDDNIEYCVRIRLTGGNWIDGYDYEIIN